MLETTALDAFIAGLSTAFFGALVAGGAYLLRQQLRLQDRLDRLQASVASLQALQGLFKEAPPEILKSQRADEGDDADGP